MSDKLQKIVDEVKELSVVELVELTNQLKDALGVDDSMLAGPAVAVAAGPAGGEAAAEEEPDSFNVILVDDGGKKINAIKVVRALTGAGLADAKKAVESLPYTVKEEVSKEEAEDIKKQFEEAGAKVEVKGA